VLAINDIPIPFTARVVLRLVVPVYPEVTPSKVRKLTAVPRREGVVPSCGTPIVID
jgi:hypothetical protein